MDNIKQIFAKAGRVELKSCIKALKKLSEIERPALRAGLARAVELLERRLVHIETEAAPERRR